MKRYAEKFSLFSLPLGIGGGTTVLITNHFHRPGCWKIYVMKVNNGSSWFSWIYYCHWCYNIILKINWYCLGNMSKQILLRKCHIFFLSFPYISVLITFYICGFDMMLLMYTSFVWHIISESIAEEKAEA
jgi:hypothetical protein